MELTLRTDQFCIETAARRLYKNLLRQVFSKNIDDDAKHQLETRIECLKTFLEEADTKALRSLYPELDVGGNTVVTLEIDETDRKMNLTFNDQSIDPPRVSTRSIQNKTMAP